MANPEHIEWLLEGVDFWNVNGGAIMYLEVSLLSEYVRVTVQRICPSE